VPELDPSTHTLSIHGLVERPLEFNRIVTEQQVIADRTLTQVPMPNRNGFIPDTRPDEHLPR
jgi:hypothetical protein